MSYHQCYIASEEHAHQMDSFITMHLFNETCVMNLLVMPKK